ncbi:hypothetical protein KEJ19_00890 [Candidatus Bathyarchaeota archaeon]|nr:hypothetical protein [Candidatus Bathyarchaeota archaeon]
MRASATQGYKPLITLTGLARMTLTSASSILSYSLIQWFPIASRTVLSPYSSGP